jgi:SAM-dependent methyltransferase
MTQHRDAWAASKEITLEQLAAFKAFINQTSDEALKAVRSAKRDLSFANDFRSFYAAVDALAVASRQLALAAHMTKFDCDWRLLPLPEFNEQFINQYYVLPELRRTFWLEGAVFCGLAVEPGQRILELCCGMGWYTDYFYSPFASEIVAVDFDPRAIEMACRFHQRPNIRYELMDIRTSLPEGPFDVVIWDGAIEHFTESEIDGIMGSLRKATTADAPLVGYTVAEAAEASQLPTHETHFEGIEHLGRVLKRHFANVRTFERVHPTMTPPRHNLFFYASDGALPFDANWKHGLRL